MIRYKFLQLIETHFKIHKVCALLGPRQCGKTTLSQAFASLNGIPRINIFDLENYSDLERLDDPLLALSDLQGFVIIDEIQYKPNLFPTIRILADKKNIKFLILGSASRDLIKQGSETLAGRIGYIEMTPFVSSEALDLDNLWVRGGFPLSYLADNDELSFLWRQNYVRTFLERDIPNLGFSIPTTQLRRFWMMLCHYHGGIFNASELGKSLGISYHTVKNYLDILEGTFMIRVLQPWHENLKKRQVKTPKIYFRDSGIYHVLLGLNNYEAIAISPKIGTSWEGFALEQIIRYYDAEQEECYFWSSHNIAEIDLLIIKDGKRVGFEFKYSSTPKITKSMEIALSDLKLDQVKIIFPGDKAYNLSEKIEAIGLELLCKEINDILELKRFAEYFSDKGILDSDKVFIDQCLTDFQQGKKIYKQQKIIDRNSWQITCIVISHDADSPFERHSVISLIDSFITEKKIDNDQIVSGEAIIFQDKGFRDGSTWRLGMNIAIKIILKNREELKKELSLGLNKSAF